MRVTPGWVTTHSCVSQTPRHALFLSYIHFKDDAVGDFLKCHSLYLAGWPKGLDLNMAVCKEFYFVVAARGSERHHDGVTDALEVELDSAVLQLGNELKQLF